MREIQTEDRQQLRSFYRHFAAAEAAGVSPLYAEWAQGWPVTTASSNC